MTDQVTQTAPAETIDAQAAAWFRRRNFWNWSEDDQTALDAWFAQSPLHEIAYWRIAGAWQRTERLQALKRPMKSPEAKRPRLPFARQAVAGAALLAIAGTAGWFYFVADQDRTFQTAVGGHEIVSFPDGTSIELNTDTLLHARIDGKHRTAELVRGEAYFKVKHDARHPFVVTVGGNRVVDLGTEFAIRTRQDGARISLVQGLAKIEPADGQTHVRPAILKPGDVAIATATSISVERKAIADVTSMSAWRRGLLVFKYTPLSEAVAEVNRYNKQKITIANGEIANRTIYGTVPTQSIEGFAHVAKSALGLRMEKRGNEYVISR